MRVRWQVLLPEGLSRMSPTSHPGCQRGWWRDLKPMIVASAAFLRLQCDSTLHGLMPKYEWSVHWGVPRSRNY